MKTIKMLGLGTVTIFRFLFSLFKYFFIGLYTIITIFPKYFIIGLQIIFKKKDKEVKIVQDKKVSAIMLGLSLAVYLICVFLISKWSVQKLKIKYLADEIINSTLEIEREEELEQERTEDEIDNSEEENDYYYPSSSENYASVPFMNIDFSELLSQNPDTVGWIQVDGTKVNYPIVQAEDNDFYLNHDFYKDDNIAGWVYADYRDDFTEFGKNTIIYGHNMNNKTMFGSVPSMLNDYYLNNSSDYYIKISTPTSNSNWKLFSVYTIEPEVYYLKTMFISEPYETFLNKIKSRSIYDFGIDVTVNDKILTLSTCDNTGTKRVAIHAKMVSIEYK